MELFFMLLVALGGSMVKGNIFGCEMARCQPLAPIREIEMARVNFVPSPEQLERLCPPMLKFIECTAEEIESCTEKNLYELADSDNKTVSQLTNMYLRMASILRDVCDPGTALHQGYVSSVECFRDQLLLDDRTCIQDAMEVYSAFHEARYNAEVEEKEIDDEEARLNYAKERQCMVMGYSTACFLVRLKKTCGDVARDTFLEVIRRLSFVSLGFCREEDLEVLRNEFLQSMDREETELSLYEEVFNLKRK